MKRSELIDQLAARFPNLVKEDAALSVQALLQAMTQTLSNGNRVEIRGFGVFSINQRLARQSRNPKTGEAVQVPAKYVPVFKAGKEMRERVDS